MTPKWGIWQGLAGLKGFVIALSSVQASRVVKPNFLHPEICNMGGLLLSQEPDHGRTPAHPLDSGPPSRHTSG
jgi:hypothetical protein